MQFKDSFALGKAGESIISKYLRSLGCNMLPVYEKIIDEGKGPQIFTPLGFNLIAPDFLSWDGTGARWIEAKHKSAFTFHRRTEKWTTGIDYRHYVDYVKIAENSPWDVWLFFLQNGKMAKNDNKQSSSGLYAQNLNYLINHINHEWPYRYPTMVYWAEEDLIKVCEIEELMPLA